MRIGGFQKFSLIDYPGKLSATVFTQGCNFRCPYCHNPELVIPRLFRQAISQEDIMGFLKTRLGKIDAVTITGGEPTIQSGLNEFARKIKELGFLVKLDTNGSNPDVVESMLEENLVDYIAMDVKTSLPRYGAVTRCKINPAVIHRSITIIMRSGADYEFRTTVARPLLGKDDILRIGDTIKAARRYVLQKFVPFKSRVSDAVKLSSLPFGEIDLLEQKLGSSVVECIVR